MSQSLSCNLVHVVFSTKHRENRLVRSLRPELFAVMATVVSNTGSHPYRIGGVEDHVHLAIRIHPTVSGSKLINVLKTESSKWLKLQSAIKCGFHWQSGYGLFSVSQSHLAALIHYIDQQEAHHVEVSFQDEFRKLCRKNRVEWDETYVWD